jgi:hypothetical protein
VYAEEAGETTCGAHRNWGGECAGECGDNFCDPFETPSNCCIDCDPWHCPGICYPNYQWQHISGPWAEWANVIDMGNNHYQCWWYQSNLEQYDDVNDCPNATYHEPVCNWTVWMLSNDYVSTPQNKLSDCIAMMGHPPFGTPGACQ